MTYPDPNVQAWAQYYAQGGTDPTGSVYFISVPGVKEESAVPAQTALPVRSNSHDAVPVGQQQPVSHEQQQQQPAYGSSPYGAPAGADPNAQWQAQYQNMGNQFANMSVGGEAAQHGQQGVGAPA